MLTNLITNLQIHWNTPDGAQAMLVAYIIQQSSGWNTFKYMVWLLSKANIYAAKLYAILSLPSTQQLVWAS